MTKQPHSYCTVTVLCPNCRDIPQVRRFVASRPPDLPPGVTVPDGRAAPPPHGRRGLAPKKPPYDMDLLLPTMAFVSVASAGWVGREIWRLGLSWGVLRDCGAGAGVHG